MRDSTELSIKNKNLWFFGTLVLTVLYLCWGLYNGQVQDELYRNDFQKMSLVRDMVSRNDYTNAGPLIKELRKKYPDSYLVTWQYAVVLDGANQFQEAKKYYLLVQQQRPFIVKNQNFLTQLGRIYYITGDYANAKKYFQVSRAVNTNQQLTQIADSTLAEIANKGY